MVLKRKKNRVFCFFCDFLKENQVFGFSAVNAFLFSNFFFVYRGKSPRFSLHDFYIHPPHLALTFFIR